MPSVRWIGIKSRDVKQAASASSSSLLKLTARDRSKAKCSLKNLSLKCLDAPQEWRAELQAMLMINRKCEIEVLEERAEDFSYSILRRIENFLMM